MRIYQGAAIRLFVFVTPLVTGWGLATSPAISATLASSDGAVSLNNFSHTPQSVSTLTTAQTFTIATNSLVTANANAEASFQSGQANNTSFSTTGGEGRDYLGLAQSEAAVIAYNFIVGETETFSFNFNDSLFLQTSIDSAEFEHANAEGELAFQLYDTTNSNSWTLLDFLTISGKLTTLGEADSFNTDKSQSITFNHNETSYEESLGGNQEFARTYVEGNLSRSFASQINLTLVEVKSNQTSVQAVPESSNLVGIIFFGLIGIGYRVKSRIFKLR